MRKIYGVDVSTYQGEIDWKAVADAWRDKDKESPTYGQVLGFAFMKATEGTNYVDDRFIPNHDGAKAAGVPFGGYHFFHFGQDPIAQAEHFLSVTYNRGGEVIPMVDVEGGGQDGLTDLHMLEFRLSQYNMRIERSLGGGQKIIIYTDYGDWNGFMQGTDAFSGHPLWIAEYNNDPAPTLPHGFSSCVIWQFTDHAKIVGIQGNVDEDVLEAPDLSAILRH